MVGLQSLDLPIGVRIPVSQPILGLANFSLRLPRQLKSVGRLLWTTGTKPRFASVMPRPIRWASSITRTTLSGSRPGRSDLCRARGFSYKEMEDEDNALMVVAETYCRYKSPAYYEDVLTVRTQVGEIRSRSHPVHLRGRPRSRRYTDRRRRNAPPRDRREQESEAHPGALQGTSASRNDYGGSVSESGSKLTFTPTFNPLLF